MFRSPVPIEAFCLHLQAEGKAISTVVWSSQRLGQFNRWLSKQRLNWKRLRVEDLDCYAAGLRERNLSPHTVYGHKKLLRQFFNWCESRHYLRRNPVAGWQVIRPRPPSPESNCASLEDVSKLLIACKGSRPPRDARDEALVRLLFSTGLRAGEAIALRLRDVVWRDGRCVVHVRQAKGGKHRFAYPSPADADALCRWLDLRPQVADGAVFLCRNGHGGWHPFTYWGLRMMLKRLSGRAGIEVSAHGLRHGFAIGYLDAGGNLSELADLLGHSDVSITKLYYGSYESDRLARAAERYSPGIALEKWLEEESSRQLWLPQM